MREEKILRALDQVEEKYIAESEPSQKAAGRYRRVKWGTAAAACVCLIACTWFWASGKPRDAGTDSSIDNIAGVGGGAGGPIDNAAGVGGSFEADGGSGEPDVGGLFPEGVDPLTYSVAVCPAGVDVRDVTASVREIREEEARSWGRLGAYLPASLPEGYHFKYASLYKTTVRDGTQYHMLRVTYSNGTLSTPHKVADEDGSVGEIAPTPEEMGESFVLMVWDFEPDTERIYAPGDVTEQFLRELDGRTFHLSYGDVWVGISPEGAEDEVLLEVVRAIGAE